VPDGDEKIKKVPWKPNGTGELKWSYPANLLSYQNAVEAYYMAREHGFEGGIGFILPSDSDLVVIDLDDALDADGNPKEAAKMFLEHFDSYAEISPSGKGIHIWLKAKIAGPNTPKVESDGQSIEVFTHDHHVTLTGNVLLGYEVLRDCQAKAENFYEKLRPAIDSIKQMEPEPARGVSMDDRTRCYVESALIGETEAVREEHEGNRNNRLNHAAFALGRLVGGGYLSEAEVERSLLNAAKHAGLSEEEARPTIRSGLEAGKKEPREPEIEDVEGPITGKDSAKQNQILEDISSDLQYVVRYSPNAIMEYGVDSDGIIYTNELNEKTGEMKKKKVCDGYARIKSQAWNERGESTFRVQGRGSRDGHKFEFDITAADFSEKRKLDAQLMAHFGAENLVGSLEGYIIQKISKNIENYMLLKAPKWLHGKAAVPGLGLFENIKFDLPSKVPVDLSPCDLNEAQECLNAILESGKAESVTVLLDAVIASPFVGKECSGDRFGIALRGLTGSLKTEYMKLAMAIYGRGYLEESNLLRWGDGATTNALAAIASRAGFLPVAIDNYKPVRRGSAEALIATEHTILEGGTKERLDRNAELKETQEYNCCLIITGEDFPDEASSLARTLVLDWTGAKDTDRLTQAQSKAINLPAIGRTWLTFLSSEEGVLVLEQARGEFPKARADTVARLAKAGAVNPGRIGTTITLLRLTWGIALRCPDLEKVLKPFSDAFKDGLNQLEARACSETQQATEASKFVEALQELLSSGRMTIVPESFMESNIDEARKVASNARDGNLNNNWHVLGWLKRDTGEVCVFPSIAREAVRRLRGYDEQRLSATALYKQLAAMGFINPGGKEPTKSMRIGNKPGPRVLVFKPGVLEAGQEHIDLTGVNPSEECKA
jgi:hypothetical protein